jgi:hypothetical protein
VSAEPRVRPDHETELLFGPRRAPRAGARPTPTFGVMSMKYESEVFRNQFPIVKWFVYHLTYYRVLAKGYKDRQLQNEFWTLTIDAHLLRATIDWCMVFGSDNSNPTHWKRLSMSDSEVLNRSFREGLFKATGLDPNTWRQYWESMTDFRNRYAAHREFEFASPVPNFDTALAVAYYYDTWVRRVISPDTFAEPTLKSFALSLQKSVVPLVERLLEVTGDPAAPGAAGVAR